jgi:aminobenzoyl-glutamate utilization protein B
MITARWLITRATVTSTLLFGMAGAQAAPTEPSPGSKEDVSILADLEARQAATDAMARDFWDSPELGYLETKTSQRLIGELKKAGFTVSSGVAGIPTAFVASYGSGSPVIGVLGEMDALPGKSQAAVPVQQEIPGKSDNQGCGHNLFGPGSAAAAIAIKDWLASTGHQGTLRFYGTPAEEGGSGKVYMVRAGLFNDVDVVLHWHPAMVNAAIPITNNAVMSAKFRFHGKESHTATSPERGRSALEAVEAMDNMVNMLRQHVRDGARISYVITHGGDAPNVVPGFAEVYYYVREADVTALRALWNRVLKTADAAAMGTETTVDYEIIHGTYNLLPNDTLEHSLDANLRKQAAATIHWSSGDQEFAKKIYATFDSPWISLGSETEVQPYGPMFIAGSSDVGDVSWNVPTAGFVTATWVPSTDAHTWQAAAVGRMGIGFKGMHLASQVIAMTAVDLFLDPTRVAAAKKEFLQRRGSDFAYRPLIGDRAPPLDYRKGGHNELVN